MPLQQQPPAGKTATVSKRTAVVHRENVSHKALNLGIATHQVLVVIQAAHLRIQPPRSTPGACQKEMVVYRPPTCGQRPRDPLPEPDKKNRKQKNNTEKLRVMDRRRQFPGQR